MWRTHSSKQGRQILNVARRQLATEPTPAKPIVPPPPPLPPVQPTPKSGGFGFFKFLGLTLPVAAGGVVGYAWYDEEFRRQLEDNVPYAKELFENVLPLLPAKEQKGESKAEVSKVIERATKLNVQEEASLTSKTEKSSPTGPATQTQKEVEPKAEAPQLKETKESAVQSQLKKLEDDEKADNAALEVVIHKFLTNSQAITAEAVRAQQEVASAVRNHTKLLRQAMDDTSDILHKDAQWEAVAIANKEREHAIMRANELSAESKKNIEKLRDVLGEGRSNKVTKNNPAIVPASKKMNDLLKELGNANSQVRQAEADANVMMKYKDLVDKGKKQFQKELESLMPDGKIAQGKKLTEDELNALIAHAHRRIEQLQKQLAEHMAMERQRLSAALETQRQEDGKLTSLAVDEERRNLKQELEIENQKKEMEFLVQMEAEVRKQLARQAAAHSDHIREVLSIQEQQLNQEYSRELNSKLLEEREKFQTEVAGWISRLKGIEAAVDARAESEKLARSAQDLWLSCISLNSIIHFGSDSTEEKLVPLQGKVDEIISASNKHPFVETVANTIPRQALEKGVSTEEELRHRFFRVSRVCRRLGLITQPNTSLYKYLISYMHSFFVLDNLKIVTEFDEVDLSNMDNFELISHARYWMEKGNFELALRFMNNLTGEPRRAASDWIREARILLETKQAAYTLTAHASASGLANTF